MVGTPEFCSFLINKAITKITVLYVSVIKQLEIQTLITIKKQWQGLIRHYLVLGT